MDDLAKDTTFQLSVAAVLDRIYATSAIAMINKVRGEKGVVYGSLTRAHQALLLRFVGDACSALAIDMLPYLTECRIDAAGKIDGSVWFTLKLPRSLPDGMSTSLRRRMEMAIALNVLESVWIGHDSEMTDYYRRRAINAVKEVTDSLRRLPVGPLRLVPHW